jgi:hypothetical protein
MKTSDTIRLRVPSEAFAPIRALAGARRGVYLSAGFTGN